MDGSPTNVKEFLPVNNADEIDSLVSQLSAKEKAELVQKLLGQSGLMVVMGGSNVTTSDIVIGWLISRASLKKLIIFSKPVFGEDLFSGIFFTILVIFEEMTILKLI